MNYKTQLLMVPALLGMLAACNNQPSKSTAGQTTTQKSGQKAEIEDSIPSDSTLVINKESQEAVYRKGELKGFKTAFNQAFNFAFDLPEQWRAIDASTIGDGYYIFTGKKFTDIRIYGEIITPVNEKVLAEVDSTEFNKIEKFTFNDGVQGLKLSGRVYRMFIRDTGKIRVSLYVKARKRWIDQNEVYLEHMAQSIRQIRPSK